MNHVFTFSSATDTESVIPRAALSLFPFRPEPLAQWESGSDIDTYLHRLYDGTGYGHIAASYLKEAQSQFKHLAQVFQSSAATAVPPPGAKMPPICPPEFLDCPLFGLAAKSACAWEHLVRNLLSESSFFSLPHLLESQSDLACSMRLAGELCYRQSMMVLRCYIESVVLPIYFCSNPKDYQAWKEGDFRTPSLRGQRGVLTKLRAEDLIEEDLESRASQLYESLNAYIHGSQNSLNNAGLLTGQWEGNAFRKIPYEKWVHTFSESVELGIRMTRVHHEQWRRAEAECGRMCRVCHGRSLISTKESQAVRFTCDVCGNTFHEDDEGRAVVLTTIGV